MFLDDSRGHVYRVCVFIRQMVFLAESQTIFPCGLCLEKEIQTVFLLCITRSPDKKGNVNSSKISFLISQQNTCCDPSLEPSQQDCSNKGSRQTFKRISMENYPHIIPFNPSYLQHS